jgi:hypothetical protein
LRRSGGGRSPVGETDVWRGTRASMRLGERQVRALLADHSERAARNGYKLGSGKIEQSDAGNVQYEKNRSGIDTKGLPRAIGIVARSLVSSPRQAPRLRGRGRFLKDR